MASNILVALLVVFSREALPWTVVMPNKFREGWWAARRMANASCIPQRYLLIYGHGNTLVVTFYTHIVA